MLTPAPGSAVYGLALDPKLGLAWTTAAGVVLSGRISPRFGTVKGTPLDVKLSADEAGGLHRDQLSAGAPASLVRALVVTDLRFTFVPADNRWAGSITVTSPIFKALKIPALIRASGGAISGAMKISNAIVRQVVKLRSFDVQLLMDPLRVEGTIDAVAGPLDLFAFKGTVRDDLSSGRIAVNGTARLFGIPLNFPKLNLMNGVGGGFGQLGGVQPLFDVGGGLQTALPAGGAPLPPVELPNFPLSGFGGLIGGSFFASGGGAGHFKVLGVDIGGQFFFSEKGFGACGRLGPINAGFALTWSPFRLDVMGPFVCDIGPWKATVSAAQAGGGRSLRLGRGKQLVRFTGDTAPPLVVLTGPGGRTVTTPAAGAPPLVSKDVVVLRDPAAKTTYVGLADGGGGPGRSPSSQARRRSRASTPARCWPRRRSARRCSATAPRARCAGRRAGRPGSACASRNAAPGSCGRSAPPAAAAARCASRPPPAAGGGRSRRPCCRAATRARSSPWRGSRRREAPAAAACARSRSR